MTKQNVWMSWSSGKDSAWSLYQLQQHPDVEVSAIFCTINQAFERVAMHGVRAQLLQQQADALELPLHVIEIPYPCSNEDYNAKMAAFVETAKAHEVDAFGFGDLFLEDIRAYRERNLQATGINAIFPLWRTPTDLLARDMLAGGLETVVTSVDLKQLDSSFAGRLWDEAFLDDLPDSADPCGENGEFHSFVFDGPMFKHSLEISVGEVVERDGFIFADVLPDGAD